MWIIVCVLTIIIVKQILNWRRPANFPPGPLGLPVIGNALDIKRLMKETKFYGRTWCKLAEKYGPVVGIRIGFSDPIIIVSGKDAVFEVLNRPEFDGRPDGFIYRYRSGGIRRGIMFTDGDVWNIHRRFLLRTLREFGFGKVTMEDLILNDAVTLSNVVEKLAGHGPIKNLRNIASVAILNSLWSLITGSRYNIEEENPKLMGALSIVNSIIRDSTASGGVLNNFPFLRYIIPNLIGFTAFNERLKIITKCFKDEIDEHRRTRVPGQSRDFIDEYLEQIDTQDESSTVFNDEELSIILRELFTAGVETTNNTLGFIILHLILRQDIQKKVHDEIDSVIGKENLPSLAHKNRMPYINAVISEVSRVTNVGPTSLPHRPMRNTTLLGYELKKNYMILANLISVHMDKDHWGDPENFRPERFLNDKGQYVDDPWLISFSLGRRRCPGESLAKSSLFLFTVCLLQRFNFSLPDGCPLPSLEGVEGLTVAPPDINIIVRKRI